uniref:RRM domain-containing protein n=1 Tax=Vannella robusta TaxID=1487602 RepID=A0A7S4ICD7_9EUKA
MPPPHKRAKKNWEDSGSESSSEESEEQVVDVKEEVKEEPSDQETKANEKQGEENPYLFTKNQGSFDNDKTVFVGQLPKSITAPQIRSLFTRSGEISRVVIMKFKDTGKPMGSAFVEFGQTEGAANAIARNGENYKSKKLRINMASQKPTKPALHANLSSRDRDARLVYVGNLNFKTERPQIIQFFKHCGKIQSIDLPLWKDSGRKRGFAMVEFLDPKSIAAALKLDGTELDGREVVIQQRSDNRGTKPVKERPFIGRKRERKEK